MSSFPRLSLYGLMVFVFSLQLSCSEGSSTDTPPPPATSQIIYNKNANSDLGVIISSNSGESIVIFQETTTRNLLEAISHFSDGTTATMVYDINGLPASLTIDNTTFTYSNHTTTTVDISYSNEDGSSTLTETLTKNIQSDSKSLNQKFISYEDFETSVDDAIDTLKDLRKTYLPANIAQTVIDKVNSLGNTISNITDRFSINNKLTCQTTTNAKCAKSAGDNAEHLIDSVESIDPSNTSEAGFLIKLRDILADALEWSDEALNGDYDSTSEYTSDLACEDDINIALRSDCNICKDFSGTWKFKATVYQNTCTPSANGDIKYSTVVITQPVCTITSINGYPFNIDIPANDREYSLTPDISSYTTSFSQGSGDYKGTVTNSIVNLGLYTPMDSDNSKVEAWGQGYFHWLNTSTTYSGYTCEGYTDIELISYTQ